MRKRLLMLLAATVLAAVAYAQEAQKPGSPGGTVPPATAGAEAIVPEWLYGEVVSVDVANKGLQVRYLDYNTDVEKQDTVFVDDSTAIEGVKSLQDLKPQDTVSIDYIVDANGKFRAVAVSLETFEEDSEPVLEELTPEPEKLGPAPAR